jgi:hypothetical protein
MLSGLIQDTTTEPIRQCGPERELGASRGAGSRGVGGYGVGSEWPAWRSTGSSKVWRGGRAYLGI